MLHSIWLPPQPSDVLQQALLPQTLLYALIPCCMAHISHTFALKLSLCWWGVFKSHGSRHFELNTIPCPNNVRPQNIDLAPEEMQGQVCAVWMYVILSRSPGLSLGPATVEHYGGRQRGGLEPGTSAGKRQVMELQTGSCVRPGAEGAPGG